MSVNFPAFLFAAPSRVAWINTLQNHFKFYWQCLSERISYVSLNIHTCTGARAPTIFLLHVSSYWLVSNFRKEIEFGSWNILKVDSIKMLASTACSHVVCDNIHLLTFIWYEGVVCLKSNILLHYVRFYHNVWKLCDSS